MGLARGEQVNIPGGGEGFCSSRRAPWLENGRKPEGFGNWGLCDALIRE